ncbi:MAG: glutathione peroxidase [Planctomycetota bacterium]
MPRLDGTEQPLSDYKGDVVLMVNVASRCGLTPQYEQLQALHDANKDRGLRVVAFPANDFGSQEPGTNDEIAAFCSERYGVTFPMFAKITVTGEGAHPLYKQLAAQPEPVGGAPRWNFTKFLVDRSGRVVARFGPRVRPDDKKLMAEIERLLMQPEPESASG